MTAKRREGASRNDVPRNKYRAPPYTLISDTSSVIYWAKSKMVCLPRHYTLSRVTASKTGKYTAGKTTSAAAHRRFELFISAIHFKVFASIDTEDSQSAAVLFITSSYGLLRLD